MPAIVHWLCVQSMNIEWYRWCFPFSSFISVSVYIRFYMCRKVSGLIVIIMRFSILLTAAISVLCTHGVLLFVGGSPSILEWNVNGFLILKFDLIYSHSFSVSFGSNSIYLSLAIIYFWSQRHIRLSLWLALTAFITGIST